jgi:arsenate reductase-like glutaredoxin family protein
MECDYCHKTYSNKYTLKTHQTTSKHCNSDGKDSPFQCVFCNKNMSSKARLDQHLSKCQNKTISIIDEKDAKISELENKIKAIEQNSIIQQLQLEIQLLKHQVQSKDEQIKTLISIIKADSKVGIPMLNTSIEYINQTVLPFINLEIIKGGYRRIIRCVVENFLTDEDGVIKYKCTDISRRVFIYISKAGETIRDKNCSKLAEILSKTDIVKSCMSILKQRENNELYNLFIENGEARSITTIFKDELKLSTEMTKLLC